MATESFFSNASLAYLASAGAGKDGKAYSIKPTDGSGDFTFSRGSNLAATRVGPTGLIEKGRENLFTQSNNFSSTDWAKTRASVTGGQTGYDGSSDAWLFQATSNSPILSMTKSAGVSTWSIYAKSGTAGGIFLYVSDGATYPLLSFNLDAGTTNSTSNEIDTSVEDVGNGWYRLSLTANVSSASYQFLVRNADGSDVTTGANIYIQDAQLEIGLAATDYIESGATTGKAGLLEDEPRFDYSGGATCPSLLLEPSRTNLFEYSEYFGDSAWFKGNIGLLHNDATSPEGVTNATKIYPTSSGSARYLYNATSGASSIYTISAYVKANGKNVVWLYMHNIVSEGVVYFDLSDESIQEVDGTSNTITGDIQDAGNGWYRISATIGTALALSSGSGIGVSDAKGSLNVTTNGTDGILVYGLQLEVGSYPTSYIPNHSGGSVTRGADNTDTISGFSSLIGQTEGTLFLDIENTVNGTEIFSLDANTNNSIFLRSVSNLYGAYLWSDGTVWSPTTSVSINDRIKIAIAYQTDNFAVYANGVQVATNNSLTWTPNQSIDRLLFNRGGWIASKNKAKYNQLLLFKERLSNADLETLTTL